MKQSLARGLASILTAVALLILPTAPVWAQQRQGGSGLQITPTRHEISVDPGAEKTIAIGLKNVSGIDVVAKVAVNDFEADNTTGNPKINVDSSKQFPRSIKKFLRGTQDLPLTKDEVKNTNLTVSVPKDTPPGAYYGIVRYQAIPKDQGQTDKTSVSLTASVGVIVLLDVPGEVTESMNAVSIKPERNGKTTSFFTNAPDKLAVELKNTGNSFIKPFGKVSITKKGGKEVYSYELNNTDPRGNVLPGSTRIFRDGIKNVSSFGKYTATASIGYGKTGQVVTLRSSFWVVPTTYLIGMFVLLLLVVALGFVLYRKSTGHHKSHRRA